MEQRQQVCVRGVRARDCQASQVFVRSKRWQVPRGLAARIPGFHPGGPGSIPGAGAIPFRQFPPPLPNPVSSYASITHPLSTPPPSTPTLWPYNTHNYYYNTSTPSNTASTNPPLRNTLPPTLLHHAPAHPPPLVLRHSQPRLVRATEETPGPAWISNRPIPPNPSV